MMFMSLTLLSNNRPIAINMARVQAIVSMSTGSVVHFSEGANWHVNETFDEIAKRKEWSTR